MKTRGIVDLYLPSGIAYHVKVILTSFLLVVFSRLIQNSPVFKEMFVSYLVVMVVQLEIYLLIGFRLFRFNAGKTRNEITRSKIFRFILFYVFCLIIALIFSLFSLTIVYVHYGYDLGKLFYNFIHYDLKVWFPSINFGLLFGAIIFFYLQWQEAMKRELLLKEQNLIFQNATLKAQINPHFLFNSFNTLSSLVADNPGLAEEFIGKLSSTYHYILDNSVKNAVSLDEEITFVQDYFYLHKIRDDEKIELDINIREANRYKILPVSLQLLIENALKHNMATRENPLKIKIFMDDEYISVSNNRQKMASSTISPKIGLQNLNQRLYLIAGKELVIEKTPAEFIVKIPLMQ